MGFRIRIYKRTGDGQWEWKKGGKNAIIEAGELNTVKKICKNLEGIGCKLQSHIWLTASSYMTRHSRISKYSTVLDSTVGSPFSYMTLHSQISVCTRSLFNVLVCTWRKYSKNFSQWAFPPIVPTTSLLKNPFLFIKNKRLSTVFPQRVSPPLKKMLWFVLIGQCCPHSLVWQPCEDKIL